MSEGYGTGDICTGNNSINQNSKGEGGFDSYSGHIYSSKVSCLLLSKPFCKLCSKSRVRDNRCLRIGVWDLRYLFENKPYIRSLGTKEVTSQHKDRFPFDKGCCKMISQVGSKFYGHFVPAIS